VFESIFIGSGFAFAAAIQPGPLQAFLLASVAQRGWKRTLPAAFAPVISDIPIAILVLLILKSISQTMTIVLQAAGGVFLIYLAWASYRRWKRQTTIELKTDGSTPRTVLQAATVNILNPNPYLGWSLVLGPAVLAAWRQSPPNTAALIIAFYATMVAVLAGTVFLFGLARLLGPTGRRTLVLVSAVTLAALGVYQLVSALMKAGSALRFGAA